MKCDDIQHLLPDFEDGHLHAAEAERVRRHLETCPACAREAEAQRRLAAALRAPPSARPGPRLDAMFHTWLESEREAASFRARALTPPRVSWLRALMSSTGANALAACVLFAAGLFIGIRVLQPAAAVVTVRDEAMASELARLREQVEDMNQAVTWSVLQQGSTSDRLQNVLASSGAPAGSQTRHELLSLVAYDPSSTVRQSAVEALYRYAEDPAVRRAVATALPRESSPIVQLAMIDLLAATRDADAATALATFASSETTDTVVRDAASQALTRM